ncbi:hypothetical protein, partial [Methylosinus sp. R-45379]|uniref:hypothetical protein n=1 Tax=Methylosinus sp. R-45379 TaxID=980563 RepID=UPI001AECA55F
MQGKSFSPKAAGLHMGTGVLGFIGVICVTAFGVILRFALEALDKADPYKASRWFFLAFIPLGVFAVLWSINGDATMLAKNIVLGLVGALIGSSGFIFVGHALG